MREPKPRKTEEKLALFRACFTGLTHVYGTFDARSGEVFQVKQAVTDEVFLRHLQGRQPYGVYLLTGDRTRAAVADFDASDPAPPLEFIRAVRECGLSAYLERSKRKGWHAWMWFHPRGGIPAVKARVVIRHLLTEIGQANIEIFPKQDRLDAQNPFGNFVFAPLNGAFVPQGRTVFVDPNEPSRPLPDQWEFLAAVTRLNEEALDSIIEAKSLTTPVQRVKSDESQERLFALPPCAQTMLKEGVTHNQRVACFRLACHLRRAGLPLASAVAVLRDWATRNKPADGKEVIRIDEVAS